MLYEDPRCWIHKRCRGELPTGRNGRYSAASLEECAAATAAIRQAHELIRQLRAAI